MKIKNVPDTSGLTCKCNGWLLHWEKMSSNKATYCVVDGCTEKATLGAHIKILNDVNFPGVYILPMCDSHNKNDKELLVKGGYSIISANPKQTCDK